MKILLDTDIGTDPDDALCLTYLLKQRECELLGVTTVGREPWDRATCVSALCRRFGADDVPIHAGMAYPQFPNPYWWDHLLNQDDTALRWGGRPGSDFPRDTALDFLRKTIREHPGEITLIAVGLYSNVSLLLMADPEAAGMLKEIIVMGGRFPYAPYVGDCNIMLDPVAAANVFHRASVPVRVVPLNATRTCHASFEEMVSDFEPEHLRIMFEMAHGPAKLEQRKRGEKVGGIGAHDPLTAACLFKPEILKWRRGRIGVKLYDRKSPFDAEFPDDALLGALYFEPDEQGPHEVAMESDRESFRRELLRVIQAP